MIPSGGRGLFRAADLVIGMRSIMDPNTVAARLSLWHPNCSLSVE